MSQIFLNINGKIFSFLFLISYAKNIKLKHIDVDYDSFVVAF